METEPKAPASNQSLAGAFGYTPDRAHLLGGNGLLQTRQKNLLDEQQGYLSRGGIRMKW